MPGPGSARGSGSGSGRGRGRGRAGPDARAPQYLRALPCRAPVLGTPVTQVLPSRALQHRITLSLPLSHHSLSKW